MIISFILFILSSSFSSCSFFLGGGVYFFLFLLLFLTSSCLFSSSCVASLLHFCYCYYYISFLFSFFASISFDCPCCCVFVCSYSSSFSSFGSSPPPLRALEKESNGKNKYLISLPLGHLCENVRSKIIVSVLLLWVPFVHKTCLFGFLGICCEGVGILCCFFFVVILLFWCLEKNLRSVQLFSCAWMLWIGCLFCSCSSYFCASACLVFFGFWFVSFQFSSSSWDCLFVTALSSCCFFYFISWLLVFLCGFSDCLLMEPSWGPFDFRFSVFPIIGVFG